MTFLSEFANQENLNDLERDVLAAVDVRSAEDIDSLVNAFPSIADLGVRLPIVSNAAAHRVSAAYANMASSTAAQPPQTGLGANPPPGAPTTPGAVAGMPILPFTAPPTALASIDLRLQPWPVRDQTPRGTCVSFGTTACVEHFRSTTEGANPDYSEQFLYWAIKNHTADPKPTVDGTWLQFARDALTSDGICHEALWPYVHAPLTPAGGRAPGAAAIADAVRHKFTAATWIRRPSGAATQVLHLLQQGRPVAISVPVFKDPAVPNGPINWATTVGWAYGRILNPPPRSVVDGGHCVCVTGYIPDPNEANGGYFIVRNSWGTAWANLAPSAGNSYSPEQGYGEISATYVDTYCWELFQL